MSLKTSSEKKIALGIIVLLLFGSIVASFDDWHIQFRYIPYILPISLVYLSYKLKGNKKIFLLIIFSFTFLQLQPLKIAYFDENNNLYSTRLHSAEWINKNIIDKNKTVCRKDFSPFDYPPVNFNKIIIKENCDYEIHVIRQPKKIGKFKNKNIVKKFEPRYQFKEIPLVFSHINPLIVIIKN